MRSVPSHSWQWRRNGIVSHRKSCAQDSPRVQQDSGRRRQRTRSGPRAANRGREGRKVILFTALSPSLSLTVVLRKEGEWEGIISGTCSRLSGNRPATGRFGKRAAPDIPFMTCLQFAPLQDYLVWQPCIQWDKGTKCTYTSRRLVPLSPIFSPCISVFAWKISTFGQREIMELKPALEQAPFGERFRLLSFSLASQVTKGIR